MERFFQSVQIHFDEKVKIMSPEDMELRMGRIESELSDVKEDVASIKASVSNHIPSALADLKTSIQTLRGKIKPLETRALKIKGVSEFLSIIVKVMLILGTLIWTSLEIIKHIYG